MLSSRLDTTESLSFSKHLFLFSQLSIVSLSTLDHKAVLLFILFYFIFRLVVHPCLVVCSLYSTSFSKCLPATTYKCIRPPFHTNSHSCSMHVPTHMASIVYRHIFELTSCVSDWLSLRLSSRAFCNSDSSPWRQRCSCRGGIVTSSALPSWQ